MLLPNVELAQIEPEKVLHYLLNADHPLGRSKAKFFESAGFTRSEWSKLSAALLHIAETHEIASMVESVHGVKYVVDGVLECPDGRQPAIRTVWILDKLPSGELAASPRLVTAHPL